MKKTYTKTEVITLYDWELVLSVKDPLVNRPRRLSIHTIAAVLGRNAYEILAEMQESGKVEGYVCPDVQTPIFYLKSFIGQPGMITGHNADVWEEARMYLDAFPPDKYKGFIRFPAQPRNPKTGAIDFSIKPQGPMGPRRIQYASTEPFEKPDFPYRDAILAALKEFREAP